MAAAAAALGAANGDDALANLQQAQRDLTAQRKAVTKDLKNEKRRRDRLMEKAKNLSNEELGMVLAARAKSAAKAKAKAKAAAKAKAKAKAMPGGAGGAGAADGGDAADDDDAGDGAGDTEGEEEMAH